VSEIKVGVACEDRGHFRVVTRLIDDALVSTHVWLDGILEDCRAWRGLDEDRTWYKYDRADAYDLRPIQLDGVTISPQGHIGGKPLKPEANMWRRVLMRFVRCSPVPDIVVVVRDLDGYAERKEGLQQVRDGISWPFDIVFAGPNPEVEAWEVSGFVPGDQKEREALDALSAELAFDPTLESHRLTSHPNDAPRDAKKVLLRLCAGARDRLDACLSDRATLHARGQHNGAAAFLDEVDQHIVPLFGRAS
jgi:hypothetical protein